MADRPPLNKTFEKPLDREAYERQQLLLSLTQEQLRHVRDEEQENRKRIEKREQELEQRKQEDIEKEVELVDREIPQLILTPEGPRNHRRTPEERRQLAEQRVADKHKAELSAFEKNLQTNVTLLIASYGRDKQWELDETREKLQEQAEAKREDREKTDLTKERKPDGPEKETGKDAQAREDHFHKRVAERIRKAKERGERGKDRDDRERD